MAYDRTVRITRRAPSQDKNADAREALIDMAEANHAEYPQYRGHWDAWKLAELTSDTFTKTGQLRAPAGTLVLVGPSPDPHLQVLVAYIPDRDGGGNFAIASELVRILDTTQHQGRTPQTPGTAGR